MYYRLRIVPCSQTFVVIALPMKLKCMYIMSGNDCSHENKMKYYSMYLGTYNALISSSGSRTV